MRIHEINIDNRLFTLEVGDIDDRFQGEGIFQIVVLYVNSIQGGKKELLNTTFGSEIFLSEFCYKIDELPFLKKLKGLNILIDWLKFNLEPVLVQRSMKIEKIMKNIKQ